jgi:hypothetical protein
MVKVNITPNTKPIPAPGMREVCVLKYKGYTGTNVYLVFYVPGPHPQYLFVGDSNAFLRADAWDRHVNEYYDHVGTFSQDKMEVTINA